MGQPNTMSNSSVQQNSNNKKKSSNYAKTLAEIKNSISQFERTEQGQNMGRPGSSASIGSAADFVNYMMSLGFDEVRTNTFFGFCLIIVVETWKPCMFLNDEFRIKWGKNKYIFRVKNHRRSLVEMSSTPTWGLPTTFGYWLKNNMGSPILVFY